MVTANGLTHGYCWLLLYSVGWDVSSEESIGWSIDEAASLMPMNCWKSESEVSFASSSLLREGLIILNTWSASLDCAAQYSGDQWPSTICWSRRISSSYKCASQWGRKSFRGPKKPPSLRIWSSDGFFQSSVRSLGCVIQCPFSFLSWSFSVSDKSSARTSAIGLPLEYSH